METNEKRKASEQIQGMEEAENDELTHCANPECCHVCKESDMEDVLVTIFGTKVKICPKCYIMNGDDFKDKLRKQNLDIIY